MLWSYLEIVWSFQVLLLTFVRWHQSSDLWRVSYTPTIEARFSVYDPVLMCPKVFQYNCWERALFTVLHKYQILWPNTCLSATFLSPLICWSVGSWILTGELSKFLELFSLEYSLFSVVFFFFFFVDTSYLGFSVHSTLSPRLREYPGVCLVPCFLDHTYKPFWPICLNGHRVLS